MKSWLRSIKRKKRFLKRNYRNKKIFLITTYRGYMSKKKKSQWAKYKTFTLKDGTKFKALNESDAKLYREKVGEK